MKHACVIGWPIEHSRSPAIHGYWLAQHGINGTYTKKEVAPENLETFLRTLAENDIAGCNATIPHKEHAYALADHLEPSAVAVKAANTVWFENGKLCAANTDTYGYMAYLEQKFPDWQTTDAPVSVLGAGGAARAIIFGFLEAGVEQVRIFNRSRGRADDLVQEFGARVVAYDWDQRNAKAANSSVLVNTTSLGLNGVGSPDIDFANFTPNAIVSDIVYVPLETTLITTAKDAGLRTLDGLGMLLHQAVPGFEKWFGVRPTVTDELYQNVVATL